MTKLKTKTNLFNTFNKGINLSRISQIACFAILFLFVQTSFSQVPMLARDNKSSVNVSDFEKINLIDGNFSFNLPLASLNGRGVGNSLALNIEQRWRRDTVITGYSGAIPNTVEILSSDPFQLTGIKSQIGGYLIGNPEILETGEVRECSNETKIISTRKRLILNFNGFGGQSYSFWSQLNDGQPVTFENNYCWGQEQAIGNVFIAIDGSGAKFISDNPVSLTDSATNENILPSGLIKLPSGMTYRVEYGLLVWAEDRNGNKTYIATSGFQTSPSESYPISIKDSLDREIQISPGSNGLRFINYKGFGGIDRTIKVFYDDLSNSLRTGQTIQLLSNLFYNVPVDYSVNPKVIKYAELPDGRRYNFFYNSYAELARVEFPTGGAIEYDYQSGCPISSCTDRVLTERRTYSNGVTLSNKTQYTYSTYSGGLVTTEKVLDAQGSTLSFIKHYYASCPYYSVSCGGRETKTEIYANNETTLLRKSESVYVPRIRADWNLSLHPDAPYKDYRLLSVTITLADSGQVSKVTYDYDATVAYNLQTDSYEYDYGAGQIGNFLRRSHTEYEKGAAYASNSVNLLKLPVETWVSSDINGNNKVSLSRYEYDNYASDTNHAPLLDRINITGHDSTYGTNHTTRGNVTRVKSYADAQTQAGEISVYSQYDIVGNVVKAVDAKGNASMINYADKFGSPDVEARSNSAPALLSGQQTFAFATSATNVAGYTTYAQFDYYSGSGVDAEDINGNISTTFYNDILDRPTQTIGANNRTSFRSQTTAIYDDANRKVTITADSKTFGDNLMKSEAFYDGFGRTLETREYETSANYIKSLHEYDSLGRAYKSSNPFRPYLNEQPNWTTTSFDSLGRVTKVRTPDNAEVTRSYYGSSVRVFDQALRSRAIVTDALGRMTKVIEYDTGADLETLYTYDVLGRLRKTAQTQGQTTQNRYFMYNDLGRLIRAKQTEQNPNPSLAKTDAVTGNGQWSAAYSYDNNGNLISTTDANNRTVTGTYDNLNRLTFRDYSDSTPDVTFTFDNQNIPNSKGKLTAVSSSVSSIQYTAYDELGRIKSSRQQIVGGQTYNFPDYTYDLSGALISQTYPSGRIVRNESDDIGRLSRVVNQLPNQAERTYLSNLSYTAFGAVYQSKLGNGRWESTQFDAKRLQVTQIGLGASASNTGLLKLEYNYGTTDNNGSLRQQKITVPGAGNQIIQNYTYDMLNRLQSATETVSGNPTPSWKQTFTYDRFGNRRFDANSTTTLPANNGIYNPSIEQSTNKFLVVEGYNYDAEGNLLSNPESQLFTYDAENRQTQVTNTASQTTASYSYDGNGKRVRKLVGQEETIFVYDAFGKLAAEYSNVSDNRPKATNYLTSDALGSPRIITNQIGQVVSRHDYQPFGEEALAGTGGRTTAQGYGGNDGVRKQFTGYERDAESGLDYAQARYFSSKHGRFTSVDPLAASVNIKNPQTFNRYSYGLNSPYKFTDPLGLAAQCGNPNGSLSGVGSQCTQADDDPESKNNKDKRIFRVEVKDLEPSSLLNADTPAVFGSDESPKTFKWWWDQYEKKAVVCQGPGGVCLQDVFQFRIELNSEANGWMNDLYAEAFSYYYSMEILDSIRDSVGGETAELSVSAEGRIGLTGDKKSPVSGEVGVGVERKTTYLSVQKLKGDLQTALQGNSFTEGSKKLASLTYINPKTGKTESVSPAMARNMIGFVKTQAFNQASKTAKDWIERTKPK